MASDPGKPFAPAAAGEAAPVPGICLQCGWGRLIFAHTFSDPQSVSDEVIRERPGQRDIALYLNDPHIVLSQAPQDLFLDPSHIFRLEFSGYREGDLGGLPFRIRRLCKESDLQAINRIYLSAGMVPVDEAYIWENRDDPRFVFVVAEEVESEQILGVANGVDHVEAFNDIQNGSSLWALAVDSRAQLPRIGEGLTRFLIEYYRDRGREVLDVSVMHENRQARALYEKLGFVKFPVFAIKKRNVINEKLFVDTRPAEGYNPYARLIIEEALRRGISVDPIDPSRGYFVLQLGGRSITCRESLSELTTAVAMSRCADKNLTLDLLRQAGVNVPAQRRAGSSAENAAFLAEHRRVVVKPVIGEQGQGVAVDLSNAEEVERAVAAASGHSEAVLLEQFVEGVDLRVIVINYEVVAAAIRKPAEIAGTGQHTVQQLIERLSRRRAASTGGESRIPVDEETRRCVAAAGYSFDSRLPAGKTITVRRTANLHTGGTIHDVTPQLHPVLADAARKAARALAIPVVGMDFIVKAPDRPEYVAIEANERPGLANHEPQPTAERFIDLLFPHTVEPYSRP